MDRIADDYIPKARQEDLVIEVLGDETLVYDMRTHKAHCLNRTAAAVWHHCDGKLLVRDIALAIEKELGAPVAPDVIWLALEHLSKAQLLTAESPRSFTQPGMSRRAAIRKIGLGAAVALPLVTSIIAPTTAEAFTCTGDGGTCSSPTTCCSGKCCTDANANCGTVGLCYGSPPSP